METIEQSKTLRQRRNIYFLLMIIPVVAGLAVSPFGSSLKMSVTALIILWVLYFVFGVTAIVVFGTTLRISILHWLIALFLLLVSPFLLLIFFLVEARVRRGASREKQAVPEIGPVETSPGSEPTDPPRQRLKTTPEQYLRSSKILGTLSLILFVPAVAMFLELLFNFGYFSDNMSALERFLGFYVLIWKFPVPLGIAAVLLGVAGLVLRKRELAPVSLRKAVIGLALGAIPIIIFLGWLPFKGYWPEITWKLTMKSVDQFAGQEYVWRKQYDDDDVTPIFSMSALDSKHIWATNVNSILFYDGDTWRVQYGKITHPPEETTEHLMLMDVFALDDKHVWAAGVYGMFNYNGSYWDKMVVPTDCAIGYKGVSATDGNHVWVAGERGIIFYDGKHWTKQWSTNGDDDRSLYSIFAIDANHVWAVGGKTILFYDGASWTDRPVPGEVSWSDVFALDQNHVWFVDRKGKIFFFDGSRFTEQANVHKPLRQLIATDPSHAWAVGNTPFDYWGLYTLNGKEWHKEYQASGWWRPNERRQIYSVVATNPDDIWLGGMGVIYKGEKK